MNFSNDQKKLVFPMNDNRIIKCNVILQYVRTTKSLEEELKKLTEQREGEMIERTKKDEEEKKIR